MSRTNSLQTDFLFPPFLRITAFLTAFIFSFEQFFYGAPPQDLFVPAASSDTQPTVSLSQANSVRAVNSVPTPVGAVPIKDGTEFLAKDSPLSPVEPTPSSKVLAPRQEINKPLSSDSELEFSQRYFSDQQKTVRLASLESVSSQAAATPIKVLAQRTETTPAGKVSRFIASVATEPGISGFTVSYSTDLINWKVISDSQSGLAMVWAPTSSGKIIWYDDGSLTPALGSMRFYRFLSVPFEAKLELPPSTVKLSDGSMIEFQKNGVKGIAIYDAQGKLLEIIDHPVPLVKQEQGMWNVLANGTRVYLSDGKPYVIEMTDGTQITNFVLDSNNKFQEALITYPDGTREQIWKGALIRRIRSDGWVEDFFPNGNKVREIYQNTLREFAYLKGPQSIVLETIVFENDIKRTYNALGILKEISFGDGRKLVYDIDSNLDGTFATFNKTKSVLPATTDPRWSQHTDDLIQGYYDLKGNPITLTFRDKTQIHFANGRINSITDSSGKIRYFEYILNKDLVTEIHVRWLEGTSPPTGTNIPIKPTYYVYDNQGKLKGAQTEEGFVTFDASSSSETTLFRTADGSLLELTDKTLQRIFLKDGTRVSGLDWNGTQFTDLTRITVDGSQTSYNAEKITDQKNASGSIVNYDLSEKPDLVTMEDGRVYLVTNKDLGNAQSERTLNLQTMMFADGSHLEFKDGVVVRYVQKVKTEITAIAEAPKNLPVGQVFVPKLRLVSGELRNVIIEGAGRIVSGEILMNDGTQYLFENRKIAREITVSGQILYFSNTPANPLQLFEKISDPDLGDADLSAVYSAATDFSKFTLEFKKSDGSSHKIALQDYLVQNGHEAILNALMKGFKQDILNASNGQSRFFETNDGNLAVSIRKDERFGEVRELTMDLRANFGLAGFYADFDNGGLNLTGYDFVSIPYRSATALPAGTKIKVEFKHGWSTFTTDTAYSESITTDWQYLQIPIVKDYGPIRQMTVVILAPSGEALKNTIELGPLSGFQRRATQDFQWAGLFGKTELDIQTLLVAEAKKLPTGGTLIEEEVLTDFKVDSKGRVVSGTLNLKDGSTQYFQDGKLSKWVFQNSKTYIYENGLAKYVFSLIDGKLTQSAFYYDMAFNGTIRSFVLEDQDVRREFSNSGEILKLTAKGYIVGFRDGKIDTIEVQNKGTWRNLIFAADGNLLKAEFDYLDDKVLVMDLEAGIYKVTKPGGITVEYKGSFIQAINVNTPNGTTNTRVEFKYTVTSDQKLLDAIAIDTDLKTGQTRTMALAEFLALPGRETERNEILTKPKVDVLNLANATGNGLYSTGALDYPAPQSGEGNSVAHTPRQEVQATETFTYQESSPKSSIIGMYINHKDSNRGWYNPFSFNTGSSSSSYNFLSITMRQDASMSWNQDYQVNVKGTNFNPLYSFRIPDLSSNFHTFMYSMEDRSGTEGEMTLELIREHDGSGKAGTVYLKDVSYWSVMKVSDQFWQDQTTVTAQQMKFLKIEADQLMRVNANVTNKKSVQYDSLAALSDIPTKLVYHGKTANDLTLQSFLKADGSFVELTEDQHVSKMTLGDGTVYEYQTQGSSAKGTIQDPAMAGESSDHLDYQYGNIRTINQTDGKKIYFSYETDPETGDEITVMKDPDTLEERRFKDGELYEVRSENGIRSRYQFKEGELLAADTTFRNRVMDSVSYEYRDGETFSTDERGTTWVFDKDGNLLRHLTRDGYLYVYSSTSQEFDSGVSTNGTNLNFDPTKENLPKTQEAFVLAANNYKREFLLGTDFHAVSLGGYESSNGAQLTFDFKKGGLGEIKLPEGDHAVNLIFGDNQEIQSGQIQFRDGSLMNIQEGIPVEYRTAQGTFYKAPLDLAQFDKIEVLENPDKTLGGWKLEKGDSWYIYDADGTLKQYENSSGESYLFTKDPNQGTVTQRFRQRSSQEGVFYPQEIKFQYLSNKIVFSNDDQVLAEQGGNGFIVSVYKPEFNRWDTFSGNMAADGDRLQLRLILEDVQPDQSIALATRDPNFSKAEPELLRILQSFGSSKAESAAKGANPGSTFTLLGRPGLSSGQARESIGVDSWASYDEKFTPFTGQKFFKQVPYQLVANESRDGWVFTQYARFVQLYSSLKLQPDLQILTVYNSKDEIVFSKRVDGAVSFYEHGKIRETFNRRGELISEHHYQCPSTGCASADDMTLIWVELKKARRDFEDETRKMNSQIERAELDALMQLGNTKEPARLNIIQTMNEAIVEYDKALSYLESVRFQQVKVCRNFLFFKSCDEVTVEVPGVKEQIDRFQSERSGVIQTAQTQLANLDGEIAKKEKEIKDAVNEQRRELEKKKQEYENDILRSEIEPVLIDFFRRLLGRDPSSEELNTWIEKSKTNQRLDITALTSDLNKKAQSENRRVEINQIIERVRTLLETYLKASDSERLAMLDTYHINHDLAVELDQTDKNLILEWLQKRDLHFGYSAFLSLKETLLSQGISVDVKTLAEETLFIDILTGVINQFTEGEVLISLYALMQSAKIHGAEYSGVKYSYEDLLSLYRQACPDVKDPCKKRVMAHIGEDHFVVITSVTDHEVKYLETIRGRSGEMVTISKEQFLKVWDLKGSGGYLMVNQADAAPTKILDRKTTLKIRGACWPLFFVILFWTSVALSVASMIVSVYSPKWGKILGYAALVASIVSIVGSVGQLAIQGLKSGLSYITSHSLLEMVKAGISQIGKLIMLPVKFIGRLFQNGFQFLKDAYRTGLEKLGSGITHLRGYLSTGQGAVLKDASGKILLNSKGEAIRAFTGTQTAARQLLSVGLNYGVSYGLEGMGLDPMIARLSGAFVSGGVLGVGGEGASFIKSGLEGFLLQGVNEMALHLGVPPPMTAGLSFLTQGALSAYFDSTLTLKDAYKQLLPETMGKITQGGLELLAQDLKIDPWITQLISVPLGLWNQNFTRGALQLGSQLNSQSVLDIGGRSLRDILDDRGIAGIGASIGLDAIGAPAVLQNFIPGLIGQLIGDAEGGGPDPGVVDDSHSNILSKIGNGIQKFGKGFTKVVGTVLDFGKKVVSGAGSITAEGFKKGVGAFRAIFSRETQENIIKEETGLLVGHATKIGNKWEYQIDDTRINYDSQTGVLEENFGVGGVARIEGLGQDEAGNLFYEKLTSENAMPGGTLKQSYDKGHLISWTFDAGGQSTIQFSGKDSNGFDANGNLINGSIDYSETGTKYKISDGYVQDVEINWNESDLGTTPPAHIKEPWFEKFALSKPADAVDSWLDNAADWLIGQTENKIGWILVSPAEINFAKLLIKAITTDVVRFGGEMPAMADNLSGMWAAWKAGKPVDLAFKFFALSGNIITELGRALVIGSIAKGLATAAIKGSAPLIGGLLGLNEQGFARIAAEDLSAWMYRLAHSDDPKLLEELMQFLKRNPSMMEDFRSFIKDPDEIINALKKGIINLEDAGRIPFKKGEVLKSLVDDAVTKFEKTGRQTTVLGNYPENMIGLDKKGMNVLNLPKGEWSWGKNIDWLNDAINRGDDILLATETPSIPSSYADELKYLFEKGYEQYGNWLIKVKK